MLYSVQYIGNNVNFNDLAPRSLVGDTANVHDRKTKGSGPSWTLWNTQWTFSGSSRNYGDSFDLRFTMNVRSTKSGPLSMDGYDKPNYLPTVSAAFVFE